MGIFDPDREVQKKNHKAMMARIPAERIQSLYDSLNRFRSEPMKNRIIFCSHEGTAGYHAYVNGAWLVIFRDGVMTRMRTDSVSPVRQSRRVDSPRSFVQYVIDMEKEDDVYLVTDRHDIIREMKKLPLTFAPVDMTEDIRFDLSEFEKPTMPENGRIDFMMTEDASTVDLFRSFRGGRPIDFRIVDDRLLVYDVETKLFLDTVAVGIGELNDEERECIARLSPVLEGRTYQGKTEDGFNAFIGWVIIPGYEYSLINRLLARKIDCV